MLACAMRLFDPHARKACTLEAPLGPRSHPVAVIDAKALRCAAGPQQRATVATGRMARATRRGMLHGAHSTRVYHLDMLATPSNPMSPPLVPI